MQTYFIIGENPSVGEVILFSGSKADCVEWIWNNCDVGDLYNRCNNNWSGNDYYETCGALFTICVDKFYGLREDQQ